jgi:hypothetical protein
MACAVIFRISIIITSFVFGWRVRFFFKLLLRLRILFSGWCARLFLIIIIAFFRVGCTAIVELFLLLRDVCFRWCERLFSITAIITSFASLLSGGVTGYS